MTTTQDMIEETKRYLLSTHREQYNSLSANINSSDTSLVVTQTLGAIGGGTVISIGLENMLVWTVDDSTKTVTVRRGFQGSTAVAHTTNDLIVINPKFSDFAVMQALNADLDDISGEIFQVKTETFTYIAGQQGYDLSGAVGYDVLGALGAVYDPPGIQRDWPRINSFRIRRDSNTTDFPSGYAIILTEGAFPGREVRVTYAAELGRLSAVTDDVLAVTGLATGLHDIPPLGAATRLQGVREGQRNFNDSQPDTRRQTEVPTGAQIQSIRALQDFHDRRVRGVQRNLRQKYPYRQYLESTQ